MENQLLILIEDDDYIIIDEVKFSDRIKIVEKIRDFLNKNNDSNVIIEVANVEYFRAIGKAIYGAYLAGYSKERIKIISNGEIIE